VPSQPLGGKIAHFWQLLRTTGSPLTSPEIPWRGLFLAVFALPNPSKPQAVSPTHHEHFWHLLSIAPNIAKSPYISGLSTNKRTKK